MNFLEKDKCFITLGIESSCDETGIGVYSSENGLLTHTIFSQVDLHSEYGGVVPEIASRDHIQRVIPLIKKSLKQSNLALVDINAIAYLNYQNEQVDEDDGDMIQQQQEIVRAVEKSQLCCPLNQKSFENVVDLEILNFKKLFVNTVFPF